MISKKYIVALVILIIFVGNLVRYSHRAPRRHFSDFRVYYSTAKKFLNKEEIYLRDDMSVTPFKYSPTFAMLVSPLVLLPEKTASQVFFTINFICIMLICFLSLKIIGVKGISYKQYWYLFFFSILFSIRFLLLVTDTGQVNLIMMLLVLLCLYFINNNKTILGASCLSLSVLFKYMPVLFIPYFFFRKKYRLVVWIMVFIAIFSLLPSIIVGVNRALGYLMQWIPSIVGGDSFKYGSWYDNKNQALYSMVARYITNWNDRGLGFMSLEFKKGLFISFFLGVILYLPVLFKGKTSEYKNIIDYSLILIFMAIFNPNAWMLNFCVYLFVYMFLIYYLMQNGFKDKITLVLVILSFVFSTWSSEAVVGNDLETLLEKLSVITMSALILIGALYRLKFKKIKKGC